MMVGGRAGRDMIMGGGDREGMFRKWLTRLPSASITLKRMRRRRRC